MAYPQNFSKHTPRCLLRFFSEGWDELLSDTYSASYSLGCRKWVVIPKESDVRTTEKLRDLELHNVTRKILARMCNRILDEVFRSQLHSSQQAFYSTGDISRNLVLLHRTFRDYQFFFPEELVLLLTLDCSKAYNNVGWKLLRRCLAASRLPEPLQRAVLAFLPGIVFLVFRGVATEGIQFLSGLAQGCPLSCYLFLLIVDPLLHRVARVNGVIGLSAFADNWSILCRGFRTLFSLRPIIIDFKAASGQFLNILKSGIVPTRILAPEEIKCCHVHWNLIRILYKTRILGLLIGIDVTIQDQY